MRSRAMLLAFLTLLPRPVSASPPPPPPEYVDQMAKVLVTDPTSFDSFAALFSDDLKVFVNGRQVASDKATWLAFERIHLAHERRRVIGHSESPTEIVVVDVFDDLTGVPANMEVDPRPITRTIRCVVGLDQLIHELDIVQGGSFWRPVR